MACTARVSASVRVRAKSFDANVCVGVNNLCGYVVTKVSVPLG